MRKTSRRLLWSGITLGILTALPAGTWFCLTYQPSYYRDIVLQTRKQREGKARKFVAQSLQLRNDICNEPTWEAVFTDQEVNAWLAEDLVTHFADQLPPEVNEPRVLFELDHIILAFQFAPAWSPVCHHGGRADARPAGEHGRTDPGKDPGWHPARPGG